MPSSPIARRLLAPFAAIGLLTASVLATTTATADHTPTPETVTLVGSLQDELGCGQDWDPGCAETALAATGTGTYESGFSLPAGSYELKVALNGSWDENYGAGGVHDGPNIPLVLLEDADVTVSYDHTSHRIAVAPTHPQPGLTDDDAELAGTSLREDLTSERFYS